MAYGRFKDATERTLGTKTDYFKIYHTMIITCGTAKSCNLSKSGRALHFPVDQSSKLSICSLTSYSCNLSSVLRAGSLVILMVKHGYNM